jgi:hypothetical protein
MQPDFLSREDELSICATHLAFCFYLVAAKSR